MLTPEQKKRVAYIVEDEFFDEESSDEEIDRRLADALAAVETPEELHYIAAGFNWCTGLGHLWDVIRHPKCDAGTALMLFWLASPSGCKAEDRPFLREIEDRYLKREFPFETIRIDPRDLFGDDAVGYYERHPRDAYPVAVEMKEPSRGEALELD